MNQEVQHGIGLLFWDRYLYSTCLLVLFACSGASRKPSSWPPPPARRIRGFSMSFIPIFEKKTGYFVKTIAVGSGQAMAMGQKGEADVLLVHSPDAEKKFVAEGYGINRRLVMHNDFIIVGPSEDPAKIKGIKSSAEAFKKIASAKALFLSRGDNSGTHAKEKGNLESGRDQS